MSRQEGSRFQAVYPDIAGEADGKTTRILEQKTVLIYGHFDVQPAEKSDGWLYDPFTLTKDPEGTGKLYGRGSSDDKGPILGWLNVFQAHKELGVELPVSVSPAMISRLNEEENAEPGT
jgi:acetylornithine deacetylase/succinyl-diaminopimelate desuccinylase-like protein